MWDFGESKLKVADPVERPLCPPMTHKCESRSPFSCLVTSRAEAGTIMVEQKDKKKQALLWAYLIRGPDILTYLF